MNGLDGLDDLRRELAVLAERLISVADDDIAERARIRARQDELRSQVRATVTAGDLMSADQIERRIAHVRNRIATHYSYRLSSSSGPQTGMGGGIDPQQLHQMNRAMDAAGKIDILKDELRHLQDRLTAMRRSE